MKSIAVVMNTNTHVETAISIYFTLEYSKVWKPSLLVLNGDQWGLFRFLDSFKMRFAYGHACPLDWDFAIVVTAYPKGIEYYYLQGDDHPVIKQFEKRRLLVTHRANYPKSAYNGEPVIGLTPLCKSQAIDFTYQCENSALESSVRRQKPVSFLIHGKFEQAHRDIEYLRIMLARNQSDFRLLLLGQESRRVRIDDERIDRFDGVSETQFYKTCSLAHFVLPLVNRATRNGAYVHERFSSSYGIACAAHTPVLRS